MSWTATRVEQAYSAVIWLYPARFRNNYGSAMRQALRDALADSSLPQPELLRMLFKDLILSLIKENLAMFHETISRPVLLYFAVVLMVICTALTLGFVVIQQGSLRESANDPQLGMATDLAMRIAHGTAAADAISNDAIDMKESLSPFAIAYDEQGRVLASSAELNGAVPAPPRGVLDYVRSHGEERVTWAPQREVRIASVVLHVRGPQGGFVLAGRNLREVEARKKEILEMAALVWAGLLGIIVAGTFLFGWLGHGPRTALA